MAEQGSGHNDWRFNKSWPQLKAAAKRRGYKVGNIKGLSEEQSAELKEAAVKFLETWESEWGDCRRAPEELSRDGLLAEAKALGVNWLGGTPRDAKPRNDLMKLIVDKHIRMKQVWIAKKNQQAAEQSDEGDLYEDELEDTKQSHPLGLPVAKEVSKCLTIFPTKLMGQPQHVPVPEEQMTLFGTVLFRYSHRAGSKEGEVPSRDVKITRRMCMITGLNVASTSAEPIFEYTERSELVSRDMEEKEVRKLVEEDNVEALDRQAKQYFTKHPEENSWIGIYSKDKVQFDAMGETAIEGMAPMQFALGFSGLESGEVEVTSSTWMTEGGDAEGTKGALGTLENPTYTFFTSMPTEEKKERCLTVGHELKRAYKVPVEAAKRRELPYENPGKAENLATGGTLEETLSPIEKIYAQKSQMSAEEEGPEEDLTSNCICLCCTHIKMTEGCEKDPDIDFSDKGVVRAHTEYAKAGNAKACGRCGGNLHPNPEGISACPRCGDIVCLEGETRMACEVCSASWCSGGEGGTSLQNAIEGATQVNKPVLKEEDRKKEKEAKLFCYIKMLRGSKGGWSKLFGTERSVEAAREKLRDLIVDQCGAIGDLEFAFTLRHLIFLPLMQFSPLLEREALADEMEPLGTTDFLVRGPSEKLDEDKISSLLAKMESLEEFGTAYLKKKAKAWGLMRQPGWPDFGASEALTVTTLNGCMDEMAKCMKACGKGFGIDAVAAMNHLRESTSGLKVERPRMKWQRVSLIYGEFSQRLVKAVGNLKVDRRLHFEKEAFRLGPCIYFSHNSTMQLQNIEMKVAGAAREEILDRVYGKGLGKPKKTDTKKPLPVPKKKAGNTGSTLPKPRNTSGVREGSLQASNLYETWSPEELSREFGWQPGIAGQRFPNLNRLQTQSTLVPHDWDKKPVCLRYLAGICDPGDLACPWSHVHEKEEISLPIEITRALHVQGKPPGSKGFCLSDLRSCCPRGYLPDDHTREQVELLALGHLDRVLEECLDLHNAKHPHESVVRGHSRYCETVIVPSGKSPVKLFSVTGTPIEGAKACTVGTGPTFVEVLEYEVSGQVELENGVMLQERCLPVSMAAGLPNLTNFVTKPGASWSIEMIRQINEELNGFSKAMLLDNLGSRLTEIWIMCSINPQLYGYSENLCDILVPELMRNTNLVLLANGGLKDLVNEEKDCIRVWTAGESMLKARVSTISGTSERQKNWKANFTEEWKLGSSTMNAPVVTAVSKFVGGGDKHTNPAKLPKKMSTLGKLMKQVGAMIRHGHPSVEFQVGSFARIEELKNTPAFDLLPGGATKEMVEEAFDMLEKERVLLEENMVPFEDNPFWQAGSKRKKNRLEREEAEIAGPIPVGFEYPAPRPLREDVPAGEGEPVSREAEKGIAPEWLFFFEEDGQLGYLSNWYRSTFSVEDKTYSSMEQFLMHSKAMWFQDVKVAEKIMESQSPKEQKRLGRQVSGFDEVIWDRCRERILQVGLMAKFSQNQEMRKWLLATQGSKLAEASPRDLVYGIGVSAEDARSVPSANWKGANLLGKSLQRIRTLLTEGKHGNPEPKVTEKAGGEPMAEDSEESEGEGTVTWNKDRCRCGKCSDPRWTLTCPERRQFQPRGTRKRKVEEETRDSSVEKSRGVYETAGAVKDGASSKTPPIKASGPRKGRMTGGMTKGVPVKKELSNVSEEAPQRREAARKSELRSLQLAAKHMDLVDTFGDYDKKDAESMYWKFMTVQTIDRQWKEAVVAEFRESNGKSMVPAKAHGEMIKQMRGIAFGDERIQNGPKVSEIPPEFWWAMPEGNAEILQTQMKEGVKSTRLGPTMGYIGADRAEVLEHEAHLMSSVMKHLILYKIVIPMHGEEEKLEFAAQGGIIAPWGVVDKKDDRGQVREDKRALMDHTDDQGGKAKNKYAKNTGTYSYRYSRQMATDQPSLAAIALAEEDRNPGYFLEALKLDYSDAFPTNGEMAEDVNDICAAVRDLVVVYGYYTFGGREVPGIWEVTAGSASEALNSMVWPKPEENGNTVPRTARCVDDSIFLAVRKGERQKEILAGAKSGMSMVAGPAANNAQKEEESGGFTSMQHAFGVMIDTAKRGTCTPLSRLMRGEAKLKEFFADSS